MATRSRPTDGSIENPSEIDSLEPVQSRHLSRSPHPYHRRSLNLPNGELNLGGVWAGHDENHGQKLTPKSSSDSGTEADDESGSLLKGLPAPPARPRKGLRDLRGNRADTDASPLVTPSFLNADQRRLCFQAVKKHAAGGRVKEETDGETRRIREKYTRRKWAEAVRRLSEMALLMAVGAIVCCGKDVLSAARQWRKGKRHEQIVTVKTDLHMQNFFATWCCCLACTRATLLDFLRTLENDGHQGLLPSGVAFVYPRISTLLLYSTLFSCPSLSVSHSYQLIRPFSCRI